MYRKILAFDQDSYIEVCSRITGKGEELMLSIRGKKSNSETTIASVMLTENQANTLIGFISEWAPKPKDA